MEQYPQLLAHYIRKYDRVMQLKSLDGPDGEDLHSSDQLLENVQQERVQIPQDKLTLDSTTHQVAEKH